MDIDNKIIQAQENLKRKLDWIGRHDSRVSFAAGIFIAMTGVLANAAASIKLWNYWVYAIFGFVASMLITGLILIYFSQYPRTKSLNTSLIFFGTISVLKCDEFKKKFKEMSKEEYLDDLLSQIHINSEILTKKFNYLKCALRLLGVVIVPWVIFIYISQDYFK